ncbi:MAG: flavin-containing monooxygenase, partial [Acidimicrobiia bacterium]
MTNHQYDTSEEFEVVVIGGGQAGLAAGYHLGAAGLDFVILDAGQRIGDAWRNRWDSLRLFTPAQQNGLPGMPFPGEPGSFPTKDEMAEYLEWYAEHFDLPIRLKTPIDRLRRIGDRYAISSGWDLFEAHDAVVATAAYAEPRTPDFATDLDPRTVQMHSAAYRHPNQLQPGPVLVVGAGNSGVEIALETAQAGHQTWLSGHPTGHVPSITRAAGGRPFWWFANRVLTVDTPIGRKFRERALSHGGPLIRVGSAELTEAGVKRVGRVVGVSHGQPMLDAEGPLTVTNVVWCTGFGSDFSWIEVPIFTAAGLPIHHRGIVEDAPGLYFLGLPFLYGLTSGLVGGVGRDAEHIVGHIQRRQGSESRVGSEVADRTLR